MVFYSGTEGREWREIKGLELLREDRTENYGGKLLVMWQIYGKEQKHKIWYASNFLGIKMQYMDVRFGVT